MSAYFGELTPIESIKTIKRLKDAFPSLSDTFHDVLSDRIMETGFDDDRFRDAVNHVIDTCIYPTPTIAQFLSFDRKIKLYNYDQLLKMNNQLNGAAFKFYKSVSIDGNTKPVYAHVNDIEKYKLKPFKK